MLENNYFLNFLKQIFLFTKTGFDFVLHRHHNKIPKQITKHLKQATITLATMITKLNDTDQKIKIGKYLSLIIDCAYYSINYI